MTYNHTGIHHNTLKRAASVGLDMNADGNEFVVLKDGAEVARDILAREALTKAITAVYPNGVGSKPKKAAAKKAKPVDDDDDGEETPAASGSIVKDKYRVHYNDDDNNGDRLAVIFTAAVRDPETEKLDMKRLEQVAKENKVDLSKWSHLNNGQISMNCRNRIRAMVKRKEKVTINGQSIATL